MQRLSLTILLCIFVFDLCLNAQDSPSLDTGSIRDVSNTELISDIQPKIGLALSGGAAHGCAHIGVIKYMEELGIPVDYITGTSMGSIIGGLLAMGYQSDEMLQIASELDWDEILNNKSSLDKISPLEKFYHDKIPLLFEVKDKKLNPPKGLIGGQKLDLALSRIFSPAYGIEEFNDLSIPFSCFAVDLGTGYIQTLNSGYLGTAIRASMAIPMVFSPVEMDGRLLVDGGLIRNFPVEDNIDMGADFIIGVYVGSVKSNAEDLKSSLDIIIQSTQLMGIFDSEDQKKMCDILIQPDVKDYNSLDFKSYYELALKGYEAAKKHKDEFLRLKERLKVYKKRPVKLTNPKSVYVNQINAPNTKRPYKSMILNRCGLHRRSYVDMDIIDEGIERIYGSKNFENVSYSFSQSEEGTDLNISATPMERISVGVNFNHFASTNSSLILFAELRNKIHSPSRINIVGRLSGNPALQLDYFKRLGDDKNLFFNTNFKGEGYELPLYVDGRIRKLFKSQDWKGSIGFGYENDNALIFKSSFNLALQQIRPLVLQQFDIKKYIQFQPSISSSLDYNSLDHNAFPTKGWTSNVGLNINFLRATDISYTIDDPEITIDQNEDNINVSLLAKGTAVFPFSDNVSSISSGALYFRLGSSLLNNISVGGTDQTRNNNFPFIGLKENEFLYSRALIVRQQFRTALHDKVFLSFIANAAIGERAFTSLLRNEILEDFVFGFGLNLGLDTPLGPLNLDLGSNSENGLSAALSFGYRFIF